MSNANMSESLIKIFAAIRGQVFDENNGLLSPEYLLLKMVEFSDEFRNILNTNKINIHELQSNLRSTVDVNKPRTLSKELKHSATMEKVMQRTIMKILSIGRNELDEIDLLMTILETSHLPAQEALTKSNVKIEQLVEYDNQRNKAVMEEERHGNNTNVSQLVRSFVTDLTEQAAQGKLEPMIGRVEEVDRIEEILSRRKKNNPIIVGDAGVGKTAVVEGLAQKIASGNIHESLKGFKVLSLDVNGMVAGTKFRGDLEDRVKKIIDAVSNNNTILFIDEIHSIISSGKSEGGMDIGNTLKPYLSSGKIRCIGATTTEEYRQVFEKNSALSRRFNKVDLDELSPEATLHVLKQIKSQYEKGHGVVYEDAAIASIVNLSARFLHNKKFPDKAIDVLDETGAYAKLRMTEKVVTVALVEEVISKMAKQPVKEVEGVISEQLKNLDSNIKKQIFGQDGAVEKIVDAIVLNKSGFGSAEKPIGSYLFIGPTGVGKTELAKQLAKEMNMSLLRFDMSEYMESHTVSKLIGAPAGYVGHGKGGLLTEQVNKNPYSVILLDEFEKANPDVFNAFLQVLDYGFMTDSEGRKIDFRNTVIIMTSNAGIKLSAQEKNGIGFVKNEQVVSSLVNWDQVNKIFAPEFRNRLDGMVEFKAIDKDMILNIVNKNLAPIYAEAAKKGFTLEVEKAVLDELSVKGYEPAMGARPVARVVRELIALPLAKLVTFTQLPEKSVIQAVMKDGKVEFVIGCDVEVKKPARRSRAKTATTE
jgi:ATP-dependent Clp protease ATP-binding subunit ClpA